MNTTWNNNSSGDMIQERKKKLQNRLRIFKPILDNNTKDTLEANQVPTTQCGKGKESTNDRSLIVVSLM